MFENLLHQTRIVEVLSQEIKQKTLPPSLLFYGSSMSAKLTTALEVARVLSCEKQGDWNCDCSQCKVNRTLDYSYLILTGYKNFMPEILAGAALLENNRTDARRYFLLRAVKKLLKRFDPILWEGDEPKLKAVSSTLDTLQEDLEILYPPLALPEKAPLSKALKRITESCVTLAKALPTAGIPIHQIRKISTWARTTSGDSPKFILMENAERMQEASRNALLKILEEPPKGVYFILLTSQKGALMQTILSRLRPFAFADRTELQQQEVLRALFPSVDPSFKTLKSYFGEYEREEKGQFDKIAELFYQGLEMPVYPLEEYSKIWSEEVNFRGFLESLVRLVPSKFTLEKKEKCLSLIQDVKVRRESFNLSASLLLETLFYRIRQIL